MCGRFTLYHSADELSARFILDREALVFSSRYNIAPTQPAAVVVTEDGTRRLQTFRWGLVPFWAKDPKIGNRMINARAETAAIKPAFRAAFKQRRCLIPASGYYEWRQVGAERRPTYIRRANGAPFAFAGLWEHWQGGLGEDLHSFTILTTAADGRLSSIHHRMPVFLEPDAEQAWLDTTLHDMDRLRGLLERTDQNELDHHPVSTRVNKPIFDEPTCIEEHTG